MRSPSPSFRWYLSVLTRSSKPFKIFVDNLERSERSCHINHPNGKSYRSWESQDPFVPQSRDRWWSFLLSWFSFHNSYKISLKEEILRISVTSRFDWHTISDFLRSPYIATKQINDPFHESYRTLEATTKSMIVWEKELANITWTCPCRARLGFSNRGD